MGGGGGAEGTYLNMGPLAQRHSQLRPGVSCPESKMFRLETKEKLFLERLSIQMLCRTVCENAVSLQKTNRVNRFVYRSEYIHVDEVVFPILVADIGKNDMTVNNSKNLHGIENI